jgi:hypothetical protein
MPILLEVGLLCQRFHVAPGHFGLDDCDPRVVRSINTLLSIYDTAVSYANAEKKSDWNKANPSGRELLRWAREGVSKTPDPNEVRIILPERPKRHG